MIVLSQSVRIHKMAVCRSDCQCFLVHQLRKAVQAPSDMNSNGCCGIVGGMDEQGMQRLVQGQLISRLQAAKDSAGFRNGRFIGYRD